MSWLTAVEKRATMSVSASQGWLFDMLGKGRGARSGVQVNDHTALSQTAIWAGVNRIARDTASVPLKIYRRRPDGRGREPVRDHALWPILNGVDPNPEQTSMELRQMVMGFVLTHGNGYALIEREQGQVSALWPVVPWRVTLLRSPTRQLEYWVTLPGGRSIQAEPRDVLHVRGFTRDGVLGVDVIHQMREAIGLSIATQEAAASFFSNGGQPRGVLETDNALSDRAYERIKNSFTLEHGGAQNWHKAALLEEGLKWHQITTDPDKQQQIETRKLNVTEASRILLIPPHKLGDLERATFSNVEQQEIDYWVGSLTPWFVALEQRYMKQLLMSRERGDIIIEHLIEGRLRGDSAARAAYYNSMFNVAGISPNEIAERENMNPVEGGDVRFVPLNMIPVNEAGEPIRPAEPRPGANRSTEERSTRSRHRQLRAVRQRKRIEKAHIRGLASALDRMVRRETNATRRSFAASGGSVQDFRVWVDEFYEESAGVVADAIAGPLDAFARTIYEVASGEVADEDSRSAEQRNLQTEQDVERFVRAWADNFGVAWTASARNQLLAIVREFPDPASAEREILERLEEWDETRATKEATREVVEIGAEVSAQAWAAAGIASMEWVANSGACPLCMQMDGRAVNIGTPFLEAGQTVTAEGTEPLRVGATVRRPQLHKGCDCGVAPGI